MSGVETGVQKRLKMSIMKLFRITEWFYIFTVVEVIRCMHLTQLNEQLLLHINTNLIIVIKLNPNVQPPYKPVKVESLELKSNYFNHP